MLDDAANFPMVLASSMVVFHAGQGCAYPTRLPVPKSRYQEAVKILEMADERMELLAKGMSAVCPFQSFSGDLER